MTDSTDPRGHRLSCTNPEAVAACNAGVESYVHWRADAMRHLDAAIDADEGFALPRLVKGWILHAGRSAAYADAIDGLVASAEALDPEDDRERDLLAALKLARVGRGIEAGTVFESLLDRHPTDLLAHRLGQFELFWNGRADWMRDIAERAAPRWDDTVAGFGSFLSVRAFSNEEAGCYDDAERHGRRSVEIDGTDVWGTHAVAHVLVMQGRVDEGVAWLEGLCGNWADANQLRHHLWWHLSLFLLERGEHARILELLTTEIRDPESPLVKAVPDATIDIQNVASLLLRLELRGVDVREQWSILADVCAGRVHDHANAFSNAHDMMVLAASGRTDEADALMQSLHEYVRAGEGSLVTAYRAAGVAVCAAVLAHRQGDYAGVIETLSPVRHDLPLLGGSHAQRDIFYQLLVDAARRLGRSELVSIYFHDIARIGFAGVAERTFYRDAALA